MWLLFQADEQSRWMPQYAKITRQSSFLKHLFRQLIPARIHKQDIALLRPLLFAGHILTCLRPLCGLEAVVCSRSAPQVQEEGKRSALSRGLPRILPTTAVPHTDAARTGACRHAERPLGISQCEYNRRRRLAPVAAQPNFKDEGRLRLPPDVRT